MATGINICDLAKKFHDNSYRRKNKLMSNDNTNLPTHYKFNHTAILVT